MDRTATADPLYTCPMHANVREVAPAKCPYCGMALVRQGAPFGLLRHMLSSPRHVAVMLAVMVALMTATMMMMR